MKCPYCKKEMKEGFVRALGRGGICWVNDKTNFAAARSADGFFQFGKAPWLSSECVPAHNCDSCKVVIINYSEPEDEEFDEDIHDPCLRFQK